MSYKYEDLLPYSWETYIDQWLKEDIPSFDYGAYVVGTKQDTATLYGKSKGIMAGAPFFERIFTTLGCTVEWKLQDGDAVEPSDNGEFKPVIAAIVKGPAKKILEGERTALNMLARASGIATKAKLVSDIAKEKKWNGKVAGTRKTTPGFRIVEKYAMLVGGADTHRMDLSSMIMLKDNHIWSAGNITKAVQAAKNVGGFSVKIEVECGSYEDAEEAILAGADVVMLDNFKPPKFKETATILKEKYPNVIIEGSGGITEETISEYFSENVDVLSMGSLTQGVSFVDFSLKINH